MPLAAQAAVSMLRGLRPYFCTTRSSLPAAISSFPTRSDSTTSGNDSWAAVPSGSTDQSGQVTSGGS